MARGLPHGRGYSEDTVVRLQEFERRARELPPNDVWFVSNYGQMGTVPQAATTLSNNVTYICPLERLTSEATLLNAKIRVTATGTGATISTRIYRLDKKNYQLVLVPNTVAVFTSLATGVLSRDLSNQPVLNTVDRYFVAFGIAYSATPTVSVVTSTTIPFLSNTVSTPPDKVSLKSLSTSAGVSMPIITYTTAAAPGVYR